MDKRSGKEVYLDGSWAEMFQQQILAWQRDTPTQEEVEDALDRVRWPGTKPGGGSLNPQAARPGTTTLLRGGPCLSSCATTARQCQRGRFFFRLQNHPRLAGRSCRNIGPTQHQHGNQPAPWNAVTTGTPS